MTDLPGFAAFILTHGRPDKLVTYRTLRRHGYTGPIYLIVDDEDGTAPEYRRRFHGQDRTEVIQFSKAEAAKLFDPADQSTDRRAIVYARVASFGIAEELGLTHFIQLDDDYSTVIYRSRGPGPNSRFGVSGGSQPIRNLDGVFAAMLRLLEDSGAITVAMSQGGDHMGGVLTFLRAPKLRRKAMNSFVVRTARPVPFVGRINEDVNAYALWGSRGVLFLTVNQLQLEQMATQKSAGGMTETYLASGTYVKSFYTVMMCPSFVQIRSMGRTDRRLHHYVSWRHAVPKILDPRLRKPDPLPALSGG